MTILVWVSQLASRLPENWEATLSSSRVSRDSPYSNWSSQSGLSLNRNSREETPVPPITCKMIGGSVFRMGNQRVWIAISSTLKIKASLLSPQKMSHSKVTASAVFRSCLNARSYKYLEINSSVIIASCWPHTSGRNIRSFLIRRSNTISWTESGPTLLILSSVKWVKRNLKYSQRSLFMLPRSTKLREECLSNSKNNHFHALKRIIPSNKSSPAWLFNSLCSCPSWIH